MFLANKRQYLYRVATGNGELVTAAVAVSREEAAKKGNAYLRSRRFAKEASAEIASAVQTVTSRGVSSYWEEIHELPKGSKEAKGIRYLTLYGREGFPLARMGEPLDSSGSLKRFKGTLESINSDVRAHLVVDARSEMDARFLIDGFWLSEASQKLREASKKVLAAGGELELKEVAGPATRRGVKSARAWRRDFILDRFGLDPTVNETGTYSEYALLYRSLWSNRTVRFVVSARSTDEAERQVEDYMLEAPKPVRTAVREIAADEGWLDLEGASHPGRDDVTKVMSTAIFKGDTAVWAT